MTIDVFDPSSEDLTKDVLALRAKVWGGDHPHTSPAFFKWLFQDSPDGAGGGIVSHHKGALVGFAGFANRSARMGTKRIRIGHGLDFMVDPELRGVLSGRVGVKVLSAHADLIKRRNFDLNMNYPNDNSHRMLVSKRVQYASVFAPSLYIRPFWQQSGRGQDAKSRIMNMGLGAVSIYSNVCVLKRGKPAVSVEQGTVFSQEFNEMWERLCADQQLRFTRDAKTLSWRYSDHPIYDYIVFSALVGGVPEGYIVISPRQVMGRSTYLICDFNVIDNNRDISAALLSAVVEEGKKKQAHMIAAQGLSGSAFADAMLRTGFVKVPDRINPKAFRMIAKVETESGKIGLEAKNWSFRWGDMDVV